MIIKEKSIIEYSNIHRTEPFFIKYLTIIVSVLMLVLFIFVFGPNRLSDEYNTVNIWNKPVNSIANPEYDNEYSIEGNFRHNFFTKPSSFVHYFDNNGRTTYYTNLPRGTLASVNNKNFIIYRRYGTFIEAFNNTGLIIWRTNTSIYPELASYTNRSVYHTSDNSKIQMFDFDNNPLSTHIQFGEIITDGAFAINTGDYIAGFSSGDIAYIDRNGKLNFSISSILSEINIVKSVAISEYGSFVASISGIRPEYLTLYDSKGNTIWYLDTKLNRRKNVSLFVSENSSTVFMIAERDIILYSLNKGKEIDRINLERYNIVNPVNMKLISENDTSIISVSKDGRSVILIYDNKSRNIVYEHFIDGWVYYLDISTTKNEYMIATDKMLYTYKRVKL